jgi:hypothetical protein
MAKHAALVRIVLPPCVAGGGSPSGSGAANMMKQAREAGVPVKVITADIVRQLECIPDE